MLDRVRRAFAWMFGHCDTPTPPTWTRPPENTVANGKILRTQTRQQWPLIETICACKHVLRVDTRVWTLRENMGLSGRNCAMATQREVGSRVAARFLHRFGAQGGLQVKFV